MDYSWVYILIALALLFGIAWYVRSRGTTETTIDVETVDEQPLTTSSENTDHVIKSFAHEENMEFDDDDEEDEDEDLMEAEPEETEPAPSNQNEVAEKVETAAKPSTPFVGKLTDEEVRTIRGIEKPDFVLLAIRYDVSATTIRNVWNKKTYKHVQ